MSIQGSAITVPEWTPGDRLRKAREHAGYTQSAFADHIGVSARSLGKYERGEASPRRPVLLAWALATGVPVEWLLHGVAPTSPDDPGTASDLPDDRTCCTSHDDGELGDLLNFPHLHPIQEVAAA